MRIVTNPGSNLDEDLTISLDVDLLPQKIIVDGISHDTRNTIDFTQVDGWVKRAIKHPSVQGTTEAEFIEYFTKLVSRDPEILVVMTSRLLIGSHDAALAAAKKVKETTNARIEIVDSLVTDVGAGLVTLAAVKARAAGLELTKAASFLRRFAERGRNVFAVATLENLIKGGRASSLQGFVANFFNIRPMISLIDGAIASVGKVNAKADSSEKIDEYLAARVDKGTAVWLAVCHGNAPDKAERVAAKLKDRYRCEFVIVRPLSTSIYLHAGPGAVMAFVYPLDGLDFRLPQ